MWKALKAASGLRIVLAILSNYGATRRTVALWRRLGGGQDLSVVGRLKRSDGLGRSFSSFAASTVSEDQIVFRIGPCHLVLCIRRDRLPVAMLATLFKGMWSTLGELVLVTAFTFGTRLGGIEYKRAGIPLFIAREDTWSAAIKAA